MLNLGDVGFSSNHEKGLSGLLSSLIRFFTKSKFSHTFMMTEDIQGVEAVQEAGSIVQIVPFNSHYRNNSTQGYVVFRPKASDEAKAKSTKECFEEFAGVTYGRLQLLWFVYRAVAEFFGKDVRKNKNWMSDGVICSELVYYYLCGLGEEYQELLKDFNPDTIQAQDILTIVQNNPQLFEMIEIKDV